MHEIGLVIASHERMWPESINPRFLDPMNSEEDMLLLIKLINNNENLLLDILRDQYPTEQDKKGGTDDFYQRAVKLEGNFTPNQESMVVKSYKRQIKSGNNFNDRLISVVFSNPEQTTINELQERYLNLLAITSTSSI